MKYAILMDDGVEEIEALTVVDILRRAEIEIDMISASDDRRVTGAHGIVIEADNIGNDVRFSKYDGVIIPGGMGNVNRLKANSHVSFVLKSFLSRNDLIAAICAGPTVLGALDILKERKATCYPGLEDQLNCASTPSDNVVIDDNIITSKGPGTAMEFALAIVAYLKDQETADAVRKALLYQNN